jgi:uncharacterized membrane protein
MNVKPILRRIKVTLSQWITVPEQVYLVIALVSVVGFAFITPPFQGPDEEAHYVRVQYIAHGYFIPVDVNSTDASLPLSIANIAKKTFYNDDLRSKTAEKYELYRTKDALKIPLNSTETYKPIMVAYSPIPYLSAAIGVFFANLFSVNPLVSLYIARLLLGITSVVLIFFAIKLIPHKKYLFAAIGLIPMLLFQQSVVTADSVSYALLALFIAFVLHLRQATKGVTRKQWIILGAISIAITLAKPLVFLFLPLILLLAKRQNIKWIAGIAVLSIVTLFGWLVLTSPKTDSPIASNASNGANSKQQLDILISHPLRVLRVGWNSYMTPYGDEPIRGTIGVFGAADTYYPLWMSAGYVVLLGVLCATNMETKRSKRISGRWKLFATVLCIGYFFSINLAIYMGYTPVNYDIVYGVQGRYFLPIFIIAAAVLFVDGFRIRQVDAPKMKRWIVASLIFLVLLALLITYQRYYLYTP